MPRIPRNPGSGKKPHNGPARGQPASGMGWGGEARGESVAPEPVPFLAGNPGHASKWPVTDRRLQREAEAEDVLDRLRDVALGKLMDVQPVEVVAQREFLNRVKGLPIQQQPAPTEEETWYIEVPAEARSVAEWTQMARLAHAKPEGSAD